MAENRQSVVIVWCGVAYATSFTAVQDAIFISMDFRPKTMHFDIECGGAASTKANATFIRKLEGKKNPV